MNAILSVLTPRNKISVPDPAPDANSSTASADKVALPPSKAKTPSSSKHMTPFRKAGASGSPAQGSPLAKRMAPSSARRETPVKKPVANDANTPNPTPKPTPILTINYDEMEVELGVEDEDEDEDNTDTDNAATTTTAAEEVPEKVPEGVAEVKEKVPEEVAQVAEEVSEVSEVAQVTQDAPEDEYTFKRFLNHRRVQNSIEIKVEWDQGGTTWEPEENLHHDAPDTLFAYWREQGGRPTNPADPEMFEVFAIRKHNKNRNRLLVEWVGYEPSEATWVPRRIVEETAGDVVAEYWESIKKKK